MQAHAMAHHTDPPTRTSDEKSEALRVFSTTIEKFETHPRHKSFQREQMIIIHTVD
jgi:hypothetical protein